MADQQKESSSVDSKDGSSPLEEGIGKGFPSSWKSISMADDDPLDFSFDCVSKGNKKTFNFDKLDMDFNLDGEFDKISSFKVDMSDLDFSSSPKKPAKSKKSKGGESSGAKEGKRDGFDFNFDFNELDSFNLDSLIKGDTTSTTNMNKKGLISDGSDSKGAKEPKPSDDEHVHASNDSNAMKPLAPEAENSEVEIRVGNKRDLGSTQEGSLSKVSSSGKQDMLIEATTPSGISKTSSTNEKVQERELYAKTNSTESKSQDSKNPPHSFGLNYSSEDTISDQHTEVYSPGTKVINGSGGKQNVINNKVTNVSLDGVELLLENSSPLQINKLEHSDGEATELGGSTQAEATDDPQPIKNGVSSENNSKTVVLKNILHDRDTKENQKATLDGHLARASSKPVVDKVMLMKDKEIKGTKDVSFGCKGISDMQLGSITKARESFKSNDSECGTKLVNDSTPATSKQVREELVLLGSKDDVKISSNTREGIVSDGNPSGGNFAGNVQPIRKEVKKSKTILLETDASSKEVNLLSSQVTPSSLIEKTGRHATQMPVNLQVQNHNSDKESFQNSRISIEGNKLPSIKAAKITPALSGFKTLKSIGTNKVLSTSIRQKEIKSSVNSEHMETQGITAPKSDNLVGSAEYQKPATSFLKRKANEVSEADWVHLRPLKRLSQSPSKSRSSKECPEKVVEQVDSRHNKSFCNSPNLLPSPPEMNLQMEVKLPASVLVEDNGNVEKAEAYTKQLEDICNLLKKKHEEAKELIVRAVVNNNNLLMLNHPIYEGKIRKVQKLALQLMSKRIQT